MTPYADTNFYTRLYLHQMPQSLEVERLLRDALARETPPLPLTWLHRIELLNAFHAYHLYLKGRFYWAKRTPDNIKKALDLYQQAIEKDPNYALAYAGVADCYANLGFTRARAFGIRLCWRRLGGTRTHTAKDSSL